MRPITWCVPAAPIRISNAVPISCTGSSGTMTGPNVAGDDDESGDEVKPPGEKFRENLQSQ